MQGQTINVWHLHFSNVTKSQVAGSERITMMREHLSRTLLLEERATKWQRELNRRKIGEMLGNENVVFSLVFLVTEACVCF